MKITKEQLKQIIKEELENMSEEATTGQGMRSIGKVFAQKLEGTAALQPSFEKLKGADEAQRAEFVAHMANLLDIDLAKASSVLRTRQAKLQKAQATPAAQEPPAGGGASHPSMRREE